MSKQKSSSYGSTKAMFALFFLSIFLLLAAAVFADEINTTIFELSEGETLNLNLNATDPDGDRIDIRFSKPLDNEGSWETDFEDAGEYDVYAKVSDGEDSTKYPFKIIVHDTNRLPIRKSRNPEETNLTIRELDRKSFSVKYYDEDEDEITYIWFMDGGEVGEYERKYRYETNYSSQGLHEITVEITDGKDSTFENWYVYVENLNRPPSLDPIYSASGDADYLVVNEGETYSLYPSTSDPDEDEVYILFGGWKATDSYKTTRDDVGTHTVTITAYDGEEHVRRDVNIEVRRRNMMPIIEPIGNLKAFEGDRLQTQLIFYDYDQDELTPFIEDAPRGVKIEGDQLVWNVPYNIVDESDEQTLWQQLFGTGPTKEFDMLIGVTDGTDESIISVPVEIIHANQIPQITTYTPLMSNIKVLRGTTMEFETHAEDKDGDELTYTWYLNEEKVGNGNTHTFKFNTAKLREVRVVISDSKDIIEQKWEVTVGSFP